MIAERACRSYVVVGAGAIGGTLAFYLARAGHDVAVVDIDPDHRTAIADHGLVIERGDERHSQRVGRVMALDDAPAGHAARPFGSEGQQHRGRGSLAHRPLSRGWLRRQHAERPQRAGAY